jgi:hypothetical protein
LDSLEKGASVLCVRSSRSSWSNSGVEGGSQVNGNVEEALGGLHVVVVHVGHEGDVEHFGEAVVGDVRLDVCARCERNGSGGVALEGDGGRGRGQEHEGDGGNHRSRDQPRYWSAPTPGRRCRCARVAMLLLLSKNW